jgi:uncharacterized DUF497 family protein
VNADGIEFDWDEANQGHIARHGVKREEAVQVLLNDPLEMRPQLIDGEERFPNIGITDAGRWLVVVVTERGLKARVVTAFDANKNLVAMYIQEKVGKQ